MRSVITLEPRTREIYTVVPSLRLPKSWHRAAGLLRARRKALDRHIKAVRKEWGRSV